jgi:uncharacterized membrane protein
MKRRWVGPAVAAAMWAFALAVYARLPRALPTHWDLGGEVDGWMDKPWGAVLLPVIATSLVAGLHLVRRVDPRRENIERFPDDWHLMVNLLVVFFAGVEVATLGYALGWPIDISRVMLPLVGLVLVAVGNYLPRIRSNWFMGIRTPWTLSSERVWRATHRVGGRTFVIGGLALALGALLPARARPWLLFPAIAVMVVVPIVYSWAAWRREVSGADPLSGGGER